MVWGIWLRKLDVTDGRSGGEVSNRISLIIALLITVIWTISTVLDAVSKSYEPRPEIGPLMIAVAAFAFANGTIGNKKNEKDDV